MESSQFSVLSLVSDLKGHKEKVWSLAWHPDGNLLASSSGDKTVKIWAPSQENPEKYTLLETLTGEHLKTIRSTAWSVDGRFLATASFDATICVYLMKDKKGGFELMSKLEGHENEVKSVSWDHTSTYLASCSRDKSIMLWDYEKQDNIYDFSCSSVLNGHDQDVKFVKWVPNSQRLFSCGYDNTIKVWEQDDDEWICVKTLKGHESTVWALDFTVDGKLMASVSDDCTIRIWDTQAKSFLNEPILNVATLQGYHDRCIFSCSFSAEGQFLATAGADNRLNIFLRSLESPENPFSYELIEQKNNAHENDINCVAFNPKRNLLATCSDDLSIRLWKINEN